MDNSYFDFVKALTKEGYRKEEMNEKYLRERYTKRSMHILSFSEPKGYFSMVDT
jgi:hypothetical protein